MPAGDRELIRLSYMVASLATREDELRAVTPHGNTAKVPNAA